MNHPRVLVTGGSGFIAGHCILELLANNYSVRTTVRSLSQESSVRRHLAGAGMMKGELLRFVEADLLDYEGWERAAEGVDAILHVASPVRPGHVAKEDDVIVPAREGTLHVLRAARAVGVQRVVLTSAFHAVSWGHPHSNHTFTEDDWTIIEGRGVDAYGKSKTLAEQAAWDFVRRQEGALALTTLLPVAVMGPILGEAVSGANHLIQRMLAGKMPGFPNLYIPIVDVRDVACAHVLALTNPAAVSQRILLSNGAPVAMKEIGQILRQALGDYASNVPRRSIPDAVVRVMALFNPELRSFVADLGYAKKTSNQKAQEMLGWSPRSASEAIIAAGRSLVA